MWAEFQIFQPLALTVARSGSPSRQRQVTVLKILRNNYAIILEQFCHRGSSRGDGEKQEQNKAPPFGNEAKSVTSTQDWTRQFKEMQIKICRLQISHLGTSKCWGYGPNVCIPPKFPCWSPIPNVVGIGRWGLRDLRVRWGREGGALVKGSRPWKRRHEHGQRQGHVSTRKKVAVCQPDTGSSPETKPFLTFILGIPASGTVRT